MIFKNIKTQIKSCALTLLTLTTLSISSCGSFDELNSDPTKLQDANPSTFINPILYDIATYNWNRYRSFTFPTMQVIVSTSNPSGYGWWIISDAAGDGTWNTYYTTLTNIEEIIKRSQDLEDIYKNNYFAVATTLKSLLYHNLVDIFGDIPMSEACKGEEGIYTPKFDTQKEVYHNIIALLDEANSKYDTSVGLLYSSSGEMLYGTTKSGGASIELWQKFTNSLRARVLLRVLDVPEFNAKAELKNMFDNPDKYPMFESNEDAALLSISGIAPELPPLTRPADFTLYAVYSEFFIDHLNNWEDPRRAVFANQTTLENGDKGYVGMMNGYEIMPQHSASSGNQDFCKAPMDLVLMSYAEVEFIKAELAQKGIITADAELAYQKGVKAAAEQVGTTLPENYFDNTYAKYDGTFEQIMTQKFYALFFCDYQQWFEYNRTGYPVIPTGPGIAEGDEMPRRLKYPAVIQRTNLDNYQNAKDNMGGDETNIKLFWQQR